MAVFPPIFFLALRLTLVSLLLSSCSDHGQGLNPQKEQDGKHFADEKPSQEPSSEPVFLQLDTLHQPLQQGEPCRLAAQIIKPGRVQDALDKPAFQVHLEGGISFTLSRSDEGLWLQFGSNDERWEFPEMELQLSRVRLDEWAWLQISDVLKVKWLEAGVYVNDTGNWHKLQDPKLARVWQTDKNWNVFLSSLIIDAAVEAMIWGIELVEKNAAAGTRQLGQWFFQGDAPIWPGLMVGQLCRFSGSGFPIETLELWDQSIENELDDAALGQLLALARKALLDASHILRQIRRYEISVPIIVLPMERQIAGLLEKKDAILWLDRKIAAKSTLQVQQNFIIYFQSLQFMVRRLLRESTPIQDSFWLNIFTRAITLRYLLDQHGLYEQLLYWNHSNRSAHLQSDDLDQLRLAHLISHRFSVSKMVRSWDMCRQTMASDWEACLIKALFGEDQPVEMANWLWHAEAYHAEWHPSLVDDDDGDGLINLLEQNLGNHILEFDTDQDGWSDFSEMIRDTDGRNAASHPPYLTVDGWFDDWINLQPHKIKVNPSHQASSCKDIDLLYYSAFQSKDWLLIGGKLSSSISRAKIKWEISLDFPNNNQSFLVHLWSEDDKAVVSLNPGRESSEIALMRPFRNQSTDLELLLEGSLLQKLFHAQSEDAGSWEPEQANLKISIYQGDEHDQWIFCEDTPWFQPWAASNP